MLNMEYDFSQFIRDPDGKVKHKLEGMDSVQVEEAIESNPEEFVDSSSPEIAKEAQQITDNTDKRDDEVNNANVEKALRKTIPGSEPDPLGLNISNEERSNWNGGKDRAVGDATLSEMDNALASRTRPVKPGTGVLDIAQPHGILGAGMLYSRDNNIPKPSDNRPINAKELEQITESNPEAVQDALPNTPIAEEAAQITEDTDKRNDEVSNEAAEETIGMGWNNGRVADPSWKDNPTYVPEPIEQEESLSSENIIGRGIEDENIYDETSIDNVPDPDVTVYNKEMAETPFIPDEQLEKTKEAPYADNVFQIRQETQPETTAEQQIEEAEEEKSKLVLPKLKGRNLTASGGGHSVSSSPRPKSYDNANGSMSFGSGKGIMSSASIGNFMANPRWDKPKQEPVKEVQSEASKAPEPVETVSKSSPIGIKSNPTTSNRTSNGGFNSGGVNKTGNSLIKVNKISLPSGEANNQPDISGGTNNLRDSRIQQLEARIKELDPELQEHFGFSTKHKHVEYNDTPIDECNGGQLQEIEEILEACGV